MADLSRVVALARTADVGVLLPLALNDDLFAAETFMIGVTGSFWLDVAIGLSFENKKD
jgi:hypothetical protein